MISPQEKETRQFLDDMLRDADKLEKNGEMGQAFDKLARGIQTLMGKIALPQGPDQQHKAFLVFSDAFEEPAVYVACRDQTPGIKAMCEELSYYVGDQEAKDQLGRKRQKLARATGKEQLAQALADLLLFLRNKRFHGDAEFSGRNLRVADEVPSLLRVLRECIRARLRVG